MTNLESLRKEYKNLDTLERALARWEALSARNEDMLDALHLPHIWDCLQSERWLDAMQTVAFLAVIYSQMADHKHLANAALWIIQRGKGADFAELDKYLDAIAENRRKAWAWLAALQALDETEGLRCLSVGKFFAGDYINRIMEQTDERELTKRSYSRELKILRHLWESATKSCCRQ